MIIISSIITFLMYYFREYLVNLSYYLYLLLLFFWFYGVGEIFKLLDKVPYFKKYKLQSKIRTTTSYNEIYLNTLRNNFSMGPFYLLYKLILVDNIELIVPLYTVVFELLCYTVLFYLVFEIGHWILHTKYFYKYHKRHHSTYGDIAITSHYMDQIDYYGEVALPFFIGPYILRGSYITFLIWNIVAITIGLINHAGYDMKYMSSKVHFNHHINK